MGARVDAEHRQSLGHMEREDLSLVFRTLVKEYTGPIHSSIPVYASTNTHAEAASVQCLIHLSTKTIGRPATEEPFNHPGIYS